MHLRFNSVAPARWMVVGLLLAGGPALARGGEQVEDIAEIARALPTGCAGGECPETLVQRVAETVGRVHRVELPASAVRYDRQAGVLQVRLLTSEERILAGTRIDRLGWYLARTRDGQPLRIRRQNATIYELEVLEGEDLARTVSVAAPIGLARELRTDLVAVCEFRVLAGPDGLPALRTVEDYPTSVTNPLDGQVTTYVIRVALDSVTLRSPTPGAVDRHLVRAPAIPVRTARAAMHD